jgi:hypothetical protein
LVERIRLVGTSFRRSHLRLAAHVRPSMRIYLFIGIIWRPGLHRLH